MQRLVAASTFGLAAAALLLLARRRRRGAAAPPPRRFADFDESVPEETQQALAKHRWLPLRRLELAGTRCTAAKVAEVEAALAERSTTVDIALRDSVVAEEAPN